MEIWKTIEGYEGLYEISNYGRVKSLDRRVDKRHHIKEKIITNKMVGHGYCCVRLSKNGVPTPFYVHVLVYETFVGPIPTDYEVNHIDEDKNNNCVWNLNLLTHKENCNWGTRNERQAEKIKGRYNGPSSKQVRCVETNIVYPSAAEAARQLGKKEGTNIIACCRGKYKTMYGFHWEYVA